MVVYQLSPHSVVTLDSIVSSATCQLEVDKILVFLQVVGNYFKELYEQDLLVSKRMVISMRMNSTTDRRMRPEYRLNSPPLAT